jgi:hypothetical protein
LTTAAKVDPELGDTSILEISRPTAERKLMHLADKIFSLSDQLQFAAASGDHNPMHVDPVASRRTQAGAPVVHGIHLLLWSLNAFAAKRVGAPPLRRLRAEFKRLVYLDETASVRISESDERRARLSVITADGVKSEFTLEFGTPEKIAPSWPATLSGTLPHSTTPMVPDLAQISGMKGRLPLNFSAKDAADFFPHATTWMGQRSIAALAATSHLVGMICPGLHSIYSDLALEFCVPVELIANDLAFCVTKVNPRFGLVVEEVVSAGFSATVRAFLRQPPVSQPSMQSLAGLVAPDEFAGTFSLIVGGSRGLGELTAKLIASGGGRIAITWQSGRDDAERIATEIRHAGGQCETLRYDAREDAASQLAALADTPGHVYYFATSIISRARAAIYAPKRLAEFLSIYVDGFWLLTQALRARKPAISLFYPSTVFVDERSPGLTEYAMAKAAGETLCADINTELSPTHVTVKRLPRMPTDQTASLIALDYENPLHVLLPIVREVQARRAVNAPPE